MLLYTHEYLPFQCPKAMSILIHYTNSIWKEIYIYVCVYIYIYIYKILLLLVKISEKTKMAISL